jgi:hypothetical protein
VSDARGDCALQDVTILRSDGSQTGRIADGSLLPSVQGRCIAVKTYFSEIRNIKL